MTVIPFGTSQAEILREHGDGTLTWRYESSGFGGILYAGDYIRRDIKADGVSIQLYYSRRSQGLMEEAGAEEAVRAVVDYCTEHYGPLSFGQEGTLKLVQSRIVGGGYAANGASLLDEGDFSAVHLEDGQRGGIPGEVMIHELVHSVGPVPACLTVRRRAALGGGGTDGATPPTSCEGCLRGEYRRTQFI